MLASDRITKNFIFGEFIRNQGKVKFIPSHIVASILLVAAELQILRDYVGVAITINSAYRNKTYNKRVGGAKRSKHMFGIAVDITIAGMTPSEVHSLITRLIKEGVLKEGGLGKYITFTHYDIRGTKARW